MTTSVTPTNRFPYWADVDTGTEPEAVGHPEDLFPQPMYSDQLANIDGEMNRQADSMTGETVGNWWETSDPWQRELDSAVLGWLQKHYDERLRDGYLDMSEADSLTGEAADYMAVSNTDGTKQMEFSHENDSDNNPDLDFMSEPVEFAPLEANFAVPLLSDQHDIGDQLEAVGANETCRTTYDPAGGVHMVCNQ